MRLWTILISLLISNFSMANGVVRFPKEMVRFELVENSTGETIHCSHEYLSHVPWWDVVCEDRSYTVDLWLQTRESGKIKEHTLMYHAKESVSSSGTRLAQFKSHQTSFISRGDNELLGIISRIDVRNGLADLVVTVK